LIHKFYPKKEVLEFKSASYKDKLLEHLNNHVFHFTSQARYNHIKKDYLILHTPDRRHINWRNHYGRSNKCVCLFDFRDKSNDIILETLISEHIFNKFDEGDVYYNKYKHAYLIYNRRHYDKLISNEFIEEQWSKDIRRKLIRPKKIGTLIIPKIECWFNGDMPLDHIYKVLFVNIRCKVGNPNGHANIVRTIFRELRNKKHGA
jgi:hypothetical protein